MKKGLFHMADKTDQSQNRAIKGLGVRMRYFPPKRTEGLGARMRDISEDEPRQAKVFKGQGTEMRYFPPKRTEGLQRWADPAPPNNPGRNGKAPEDAQPNEEQD